MSDIITPSGQKTRCCWSRLRLWLSHWGTDDDYKRDSLCGFHTVLISFGKQVLACVQRERARVDIADRSGRMFSVTPGWILMVFDFFFLISKFLRTWIVRCGQGINTALFLFYIFPKITPSGLMGPSHWYLLPVSLGFSRSSSQHHRSTFQGWSRGYHDTIERARDTR